MKKPIFSLGNRFLWALSLLALIAYSCGTKSDNPNPSNPGGGGGGTSTDYALVITNGAQAINLGSSIALTANFVSKTAVVTPATSVSWTVTNDLGTFVGNTFQSAKAGEGVITGKATIEGKEVTASIPVAVHNSSIFEVAPAAIIWTTGAGNIELFPIYFGTGTPSFTYASNNTSVATVSSAGSVGFVANGNAVITVTMTLGSQTSTYNVPVLVVGPPPVPLPVTQVRLNVPVREMFRDETFQFSARAFNSAGEDVTSGKTITWSVRIKDTNDLVLPISVSNTGLVTSRREVGEAYVYATVDGIVGQAEVIVNPDTAIFVSPFTVSLGGFGGGFPGGGGGATEAELTASTITVDRAKYRAKDPTAFTTIANLPRTQWMKLTTGIPAIDQLLDVVELSNASPTKVTVRPKSSTSVGSGFVFAYVPNSGIAAGVCAVNVGF